MVQETRNYDREMGAFDARISSVEKRQDNMEIKMAEMLSEIKSGNSNLSSKIDDLKTLSNMAKGAIALAGTLLTIGVTLAVKFIH